MTTRRKVPIGLGLYVVLTVAVAIIFGWTRDDNEEFQPQKEFQLDTWITLPGPFDINKAVLYVSSPRRGWSASCDDPVFPQQMARLSARLGIRPAHSCRDNLFRAT